LGKRIGVWARAWGLLCLARQAAAELAECSTSQSWSCLATYCSLVTLGVLTPLPSLAQVPDGETKSRIIAEVSNKVWVPERYAHGGYESGRFFIDGSFKLPPNHNSIGAELIDAVAKGEFEIVEPTQRGQVIADLPGYLEVQPMCSTAPVRYWSGIGEMSQRDLEKRRKWNSPDITPYFPGSPRPIDYEVQFKGSLDPYARATANLAFYDLGVGPTGDRLLLFKGEDYTTVANRKASGRQLEGTLAAFEVPSCRFIGTLDYFKRCFDPTGTPVSPLDENSFAQVIRLNGRPFAIAIWHMICEGVPGVAPSYALVFWDLTADGPVPVTYGFYYSGKR
jgi:hypothetical protein